MPSMSPLPVFALDGRQALVIGGQRSRPEACADLAVRRLEIPHGRFERSVELPPGTYRMESRDVRDACLVVQLTRV